MKKVIHIILFAITLTTTSLFAQIAGTLNSTFGVYGKVMTDISPLSIGDYIEDILLQPDGRIIAVGWFHTSSPTTNYSDLAMVRYMTNGSVDSTFGVNGKVIYNLSQAGWQGDFIRSAVLQNDGKIVCTGSTSDTMITNILLTRILSNGIIDSTFGSNGSSILDIAPNSNDEGNSVLIQPDGKILVGALSSSDGGLVIRYNPNGIIDSTFGNNGIIHLSQSVRSISLLANGKVLAAGEYSTGVPLWWYFGITRIDSTGTIDSTFGTNGFTFFDHTNVAGPAFLSDWVNSIEVQPDGKIIVGGGISDNNLFVTDTRFAVGRLNSDGSMDSTFGTSGRVVVDFPGNFERIHSMNIQPDGKIFLIGQTELIPITMPDYAIARINSNGTLDSTFNNTGKLQVDFAGGADYGYASLLQTDGKLVVGGSATNTSGNYDFSIVRLLNDLNIGIVDLHNNFSKTLFFPNPVEQSSTLEYSLKYPTTISINLIDAQGRLIKTFVDNQKQQEGEHQEFLEFPNELAKGVYVINISSTEGRINIKIIK